MTDLLLTKDGDLLISENGDISLTESVSQAIRIRLLWFFNEWRYNPDFGIPYFEEVFIKNPSLPVVRQTIRDAILEVSEVEDVPVVEVAVDAATRKAKIIFAATVDGELLREEVFINV